MPNIEKVTRKNTKRPDQIGGGKPGPGRKPGIPNRATGLLKDAIIQAAEQAGGEGGMVAYLTGQANRHPAAFLALIGRVLPLQVQDRETRRKDHRRDRTPRSGPTSRSWSSPSSSTNPQTAAVTAVRKRRGRPPALGAGDDF